MCESEKTVRDKTILIGEASMWRTRRRKIKERHRAGKLRTNRHGETGKRGGDPQQAESNDSNKAGDNIEVE